MSECRHSPTVKTFKRRTAHCACAAAEGPRMRRRTARRPRADFISMHICMRQNAYVIRRGGANIESKVTLGPAARVRVVRFRQARPRWKGLIESFPTSPHLRKSGKGRPRGGAAKRRVQSYTRLVESQPTLECQPTPRFFAAPLLGRPPCDFDKAGLVGKPSARAFRQALICRVRARGGRGAAPQTSSPKLHSPCLVECQPTPESQPTPRLCRAAARPPTVRF